MEINQIITMESDVIVFCVNPIDSVGDDGKPIKGCSVHYLFCGNDGLGFKTAENIDINAKTGLNRGKAWLDYDQRVKFSMVPAIYRGIFELGAVDDKTGKPKLNLIDGAYKANLEIKTFVPEGINVPGMIAQPAAKK